MKKIKFVSTAALLLIVMLSHAGIKSGTEKELSQLKGTERLQALISLTGKYHAAAPLKAIQYGKEALGLLQNSPNFELQVVVLNHTSFAYTILGQYEPARQNAERSQAIAHDAGNRIGEADAMIALGYIHWAQSQFKKGGEYYNKAYQIYKEQNSPRGLVKYHRLMADLDRKLGNFSKALENIYSGQKIASEKGYRWELADLTSLSGIVHFELKQFDLSLREFNTAHRIYIELQDLRGISRTYNNLGMATIRQGKYREALDFFKKSNQINHQLGLRQYIANGTNNIGEVYALMGNHYEALKYFFEALKLKEKLNDRYGMSYTLNNIGKSYYALKQYRKAVGHLKRSLDIAVDISTRIEIKNAAYQLSLNYEALRDPENALLYYRQFKSMDDIINQESSQKTITELETNYDIAKKEKELQLMRKDEEINQLQLAEERILINSLIVIVFLVILLAFLIYKRYLFKARLTGVLEHEIEDHKKTGVKLQESEEKFRVLAEKSVVGICIVQDNTIRYANPRFEKLFGYSREQLIGRSSIDLAIREDRPQVEELIKKRMTGASDSLYYEFRGQTRDGNIIYLENYGILTQYEGQPAILETLVDITDRKQAEAELLKTQKLETVGILAGKIAHDFNSLLDTIQQRVSNAISNLEDAPKYSNMLKSAVNTSSQSRELVQKLITFSEGGWSIPRKLKFSSLLKKTLTQYPSIKTYIRTTVVPQDLKHLHGDARQLRQVLHNILENAEKAMEQESKEISIAAENMSLDSTNMFGLDPGDYIKIAIRDNGCGIPPDHLDKVFDPYYSTKTTVTQKGMGLGLALCYSIIKKHNGHISIKSHIGKGTTVQLYIPAYK